MLQFGRSSPDQIISRAKHPRLCELAVSLASSSVGMDGKSSAASRSNSVLVSTLPLSENLANRRARAVGDLRAVMEKVSSVSCALLLGGSADGALVGGCADGALAGGCATAGSDILELKT